MTYSTVTLSSVGSSPAANLNWIGGKVTTAIAYSNANTSSGDFIVQITMDDLQRSSSPQWFGLSSNTYAQESLPVIHYSASSVFPSGSSAANECVYMPIPGPVAAIRLNSSSVASGTTITMKVIQGDGS